MQINYEYVKKTLRNELLKALEGIEFQHFKILTKDFIGRNLKIDLRPLFNQGREYVFSFFFLFNNFNSFGKKNDVI